MFDYLEFSLYLPEGQYNKNKVSNFGEVRIGHLPLNVRYNSYTQVLTVKGSLPYFYQGHNFFFSKENLNKSISALNDLLGVDLFEATVSIMEYGVVILLPFEVDEFLDCHVKSRGYLEDIYKTRGKTYNKNDGSYHLKFYLLWKNLDKNPNKVSPTIKDELRKTKYKRKNNPMRIELHGSPKSLLGYNTILLKELLSDRIEAQCRNILLKTYKRIKKWERLDISFLKQITTIDTQLLLILLLSRHCKNYIEEIDKLIGHFNVQSQCKTACRRRIKDKIRVIPHKSCTYSAEDLILKAFQENSNIYEKTR